MSTTIDLLAEIQRLAALPRLEYEQVRIAEAKRLKMRVIVLDAEVGKYIRIGGRGSNDSNIRPSTPEVVGGVRENDRSNDRSKNGVVRMPETLEAAAGGLIEAEDVLAKVDKAVESFGYAGDRKAVLLTYVAIGSRLMDKPINLHLIAPSASGKNHAINTALLLFPPEATVKMVASSPKALIYGDEDLHHRTVVMGECDSLKNLEGSAASLVRSIIEDARTDYNVVEKDPVTLRNVTRRITKEGPTGLITTGVYELEDQTSTRMLNFHLCDTPEQTRKVMEAEAKAGAGETKDPDPDLIGQHHAFQQWLNAQPAPKVVVPFAPILARSIPADEVRMRRDFKQLLAVIKAIAMLNQHHRHPDDRGRLVADLADYRWARQLLADLFTTIAGGGITPAVRETVEAVPEGGEMSEADLVRELGLSKSTVHYRVSRALYRGWLVNHEKRNSYPSRLVRGAPLPVDVSALPTVEKVREAFEHSPLSNDHSNDAQPHGGVGENGGSFECSNRSNGSPDGDMFSPDDRVPFDVTPSPGDGSDGYVDARARDDEGSDPDGEDF